MESKALKFTTNFFISLFAIVTTFFLIESIAYIWLTKYASDAHLSMYGTFDQIKNTRQLMFKRHHYLQYIPAPNYKKGKNKHNSLGYRGDEIEIPKADNVYRIVVIGGSTTYTTAVDNYRKSYPYLLQSILREKDYRTIEVINAGVHAYSSWESLINLEFRVLDLSPDLIVVYHGINDVHPRIVSPSSHYKGDNSGGREPYEKPQEHLWDQSTILRIFRTRFGTRKPLGGLGFRRTFEYSANNYAEQFRNQKLNNSYPKGIFKKTTAFEMIENNRPIYFERNLRNMIAISREHGVEIMLMTFATSPLFHDKPRVSSKEYINAMREQNSVVLDICNAHKIPCYDLAQDMPVDKKYWKDGRHVNELGADIKARLVAEFLIQSGYLEKYRNSQ